MNEYLYIIKSQLWYSNVTITKKCTQLSTHMAI